MSDRRAWAVEVVAMMSGLDTMQAAVLHCRYFSGLSEAQASAATGLSIRQVRTAAAAGLAELGRRVVSTGNTP